MKRESWAHLVLARRRPLAYAVRALCIADERVDRFDRSQQAHDARP